MTIHRVIEAVNKAKASSSPDRRIVESFACMIELIEVMFYHLREEAMEMRSRYHKAPIGCKHPCNTQRQLLRQLNKYLKEIMDKKMAKVTKTMKVAERDIKKHKPKAAVKALKGAEKKNAKLTEIDRTKRDPIIKKYKTLVHKKAVKKAAKKVTHKGKR